MLVAVTLAVYAPVWHGGPLWDDAQHLTSADLASGHGLWRIWFELRATQQYYPVTHSVFWLINEIAGSSLLAHHLVTMLLHATSGFLVAVILRRLAIPGAVLAAVIFTLHPIQVESVAWITEIKNTLSGVLYLTAALVYLRFDEDRRPWRYALSVALFMLALGSKTVTATMPVALLIVLWWRRGRLDLRRDVLPLLPFVALAIPAGWLTAWVERTDIGATGQDFQFTFIERGLIAGRALWFYLGKIIWPANLLFIYPRWTIDAGDWLQFVYPAGAAAALGAAWWVRARSRAPLAACLFFAVTLGPALGFVNVFPFQYSFVADHFQYLAGLGVIVPVAAGATLLMRSRWAIGRGAEGAVTVVIGVLLGAMTWVQCQPYANSDALYRATLDRNPDCWMCHNNLGGSLEQAGRIAEARVEYEAATRLKPSNFLFHDNLGNVLRRLGQPEAAVAENQEAVRINPGSATAHDNLGTTLLALNRVDDAIREYREAVRLSAGTASFHYNLATALMRVAPTPEAVSELREALRLQPGLGPAHYSLANALLAAGKRVEAVAEFREALRYLGPETHATIYNDLGVTLAELGRTAEAVQAFAEAVRLKPDFTAARENLVRAKAELARGK